MATEGRGTSEWTLWVVAVSCALHATEEYLTGRGGAQILADIPLGRVTHTNEVAQAIRWLATEAPAASTGSVIDLNGASYVR